MWLTSFTTNSNHSTQIVYLYMDMTVFFSQVHVHSVRTLTRPQGNVHIVKWGHLRRMRTHWIVHHVQQVHQLKMKALQMQQIAKVWTLYVLIMWNEAKNIYYRMNIESSSQNNLRVNIRFWFKIATQTQLQNKAK